MLKKTVRMGLPWVVALGLALPLVNSGLAQEQKGTDQRGKKKAEKSRGKKGGEQKKVERPKAR